MGDEDICGDDDPRYDNCLRLEVDGVWKWAPLGVGDDCTDTPGPPFSAMIEWMAGSERVNDGGQVRESVPTRSGRQVEPDAWDATKLRHAARPRRGERGRA